MASVGGDSPDDPSSPPQSLYHRLVDILLTGLVIIAPFILTLYLIDLAVGFLAGALRPFIDVLRWLGVVRAANFGPLGSLLVDLGLYQNALGFITELVAILLLIALIVSLGLIARSRSGDQALDYLDRLVATLPIVGPLYKSFRRMGDVFMENGLENFKSVKLVEFPRSDTHALAFETNQAPSSIAAAADTEGMLSLFVPLAPNPVMGGFLVFVSPDQVTDVDMTVEEAARALITSGIASGEADQSDSSVELFRDIETVTSEPVSGLDGNDAD